MRSKQFLWAVVCSFYKPVGIPRTKIIIATTLVCTLAAVYTDCMLYLAKKIIDLYIASENG